jgi:hypothetical protein
MTSVTFSFHPGLDEEGLKKLKAKLQELGIESPIKHYKQRDGTMWTSVDIEMEKSTDRREEIDRHLGSVQDGHVVYCVCDTYDWDHRK